jgi:hypothetical protein
MKQGYFYIKSGLLLPLLLFIFTFSYSQQYLVNQEWTLNYGNDTSQYYYKKATVKTDASNNVYTLGNSITSTGHDFLLMKQNSSGDTLFMTNWNGDGDGEDIAMDMWVDPYTEYAYAVGGSYQNDTDSLDPVIVVFDNNGAIIYFTYCSSSSAYNDIYTSIASDGSSYIYAGGAVGTTSNGYDFLVTEFDFIASEISQSTIDYVGYDELAVKVTLDGFGGLYLGGISEPNDSIWDYAVEQYKIPGLSYSTEYRNYAGSGQTHRPTDAVFKNNYYYITGGISNGANYDIKTVCLDTTLSVVWEQTWSGTDSMDDISHSIKVNDIGDVFITGQVGLGNWTSNTVTIKYDSGGNEKWVREYDGSDGTMNDKGLDLELNEDNVFITGYIKNGYEFNTMCYDTAGTIRWQRITKDAIPIPIDMAVDGDGNVIIAAPLLGALFTEKFSVLTISDSVIIDTTGSPICKKMNSL